MSDVQTDVQESQAVQAALTAANEAQAVAASIATPGNDPLAIQPVATAEPETTLDDGADLRTTKNPSVMDQAKEEIAKANTGATLAEQREAFKVVDGQTLTSGVQVATNHTPIVKAELPEVIGARQAGNAMDTMHGKVNATWPPKAR